jgi:hypothetical protein
MTAWHRGKVRISPDNRPLADCHISRYLNELFNSTAFSNYDCAVNGYAILDFGSVPDCHAGTDMDMTAQNNVLANVRAGSARTVRAPRVFQLGQAAFHQLRSSHGICIASREFFRS